MEEHMENDEEALIKGRKHAYTLPKFRYVNIVLVTVFIDGLISLILWLTGGDTDYFIDNIVSYNLRHSAFDLALLACVKVIVIAPSVTYLEYLSLRLINHPNLGQLRTLSGLLHFVMILVCLLAVGFSITKGGIILYALMHEGTYQHMHPTYNALLITAVVFSLIEFILAAFGFYAMRRLKNIRVLHLYNDKGQEIDKDGKPVKKSVDLIRLMSLAKPEWPLLLIASMCLFVSSGSQMLAPLFFGKVVDSAKHGMAELNKTVLTLLIIYIAGAIFSMGRSWLFTLAGQRVVARLRKNLFLNIIKQDVAFFDTNRTGELCNRLSSDTQVLQNAVTVNLSMLSRYLLQMIGSLVLMFTLNASLTGVLLSVVPIVSICAVQYGMFMKKLRQKFQDRLGDAGTQAEESISSIRTVRTFSAESKACDLYNADVNKSYGMGKKLAAAGGIFEGGVGILISGSITLVLWYGGKLVHENYNDASQGITPGILTAFLLYTLQVAMAFALMSALYGDFMQALGASIRIFELLDRKSEVSTENGETLMELDGCIEFKDVSFTYPSRPETKVLKGISLKVEPGQMVALVGPSGGGKSTIVNLIERFYDPDSGCIYLGGRDLRDLDPVWFRQKISMVSQEPTLFACSIKDNIAYGKQASLEEIIAVAKEANAHDFIASFEDGYDTVVGERGVRLSGGQKQRVAIARALIMNPKILLLDEATSALDAESEHLVQEAVDRAMKGRTIVVIAHRLSTVRNASKVVVIDKGTIAEEGTHDELISKNGVYKRLILRQLTAGRITENVINDDDDEPLIEI